MIWTNRVSSPRTGSPKLLAEPGRFTPRDHAMPALHGRCGVLHEQPPCTEPAPLPRCDAATLRREVCLLFTPLPPTRRGRDQPRAWPATPAGTAWHWALVVLRPTPLPPVYCAWRAGVISFGEFLRLFRDELLDLKASCCYCDCIKLINIICCWTCIPAALIVSNLHAGPEGKLLLN